MTDLPHAVGAHHRAPSIMPFAAHTGVGRRRKCQVFHKKVLRHVMNCHLLGLGGSMSDIPIEREFWRGLRRQIAQKVRNPTDAEDLLHAAYIKFQRYSLQNEVLDPAALIVRIACNLGIDSHRRRKKTVDPSEAEDIPDNCPLQDEAMVIQARLERVHMGIERLPPKTREIFVMSRWQNLRYPQIADRLGISVSSVEKHMAKAMQFLAGWTEGW